jgi:hypothetical protein
MTPLELILFVLAFALGWYITDLIIRRDKR